MQIIEKFNALNKASGVLEVPFSRQYFHSSITALKITKDLLSKILRTSSELPVKNPKNFCRKF